MIKIKIWWKQLWCLHYWDKGFEIDVATFKGFLYPFTCKHCNKRVVRTNDQAPISYIKDLL